MFKFFKDNGKNYSEKMSIEYKIRCLDDELTDNMIVIMRATASNDLGVVQLTEKKQQQILEDRKKAVQELENIPFCASHTTISIMTIFTIGVVIELFNLLISV